jgi:hypothetical protein
MVAHKMIASAVVLTLIESITLTINAYVNQVIMMMELLCVKNVTSPVNSVLTEVPMVVLSA